MCGLFGFIGIVPDIALLLTLLRLARTRGPDALGIASALPGRELVWQHWLTRPGKTPSVTLPRAPALLLGHARLATSGHGALAETHPLRLRVEPPVAFAHNGTVYRHEALALETGVQCETSCDSEVLGQLWQQSGKDVTLTMQRLETSQGVTPHAWGAATAQQVWLASWGQPLYVAAREEGRYWCSRRFPESTALSAGTFVSWSL